MNYKIGMRTFKTSLAVFICIIVYHIFHWENSFFAVIAAILSMEISIISSFKVGRDRVMGTILGAIVGLGFALIHPGDALLSALGMMIIITICNVFHWNKSISIAGVVFISIMLNIGGLEAVEYSINRIVDTSIGILIGLVINYLIAPYNFEKSIKKQLTSLNKEFNKIIEEYIRPCIKEDMIKLNCYQEDCYNSVDHSIRELSDDLNHLKDELKEYLKEIKVQHVNQQKVQGTVTMLEIMKETYSHLKVIAPIVCERKLNELNYKKLQDSGFTVHKYECNENLSSLDTIYNYHLGIILENMELINS
ncbi:aromatic acid exporter family protein [Alkalibaculum bacchi]|uniref:FUSC family protein n=1 Tax=Alkalibaculum bacchi TaxID=645887 RepID=UPI0026EC2618|nr:aromatic acid exporter family protein [Alkalibaculum bacchi]